MVIFWVVFIGASSVRHIRGYDIYVQGTTYLVMSVMQFVAELICTHDVKMFSTSLVYGRQERTTCNHVYLCKISLVQIGISWFTHVELVSSISWYIPKMLHDTGCLCRLKHSLQRIYQYFALYVALFGKTMGIHYDQCKYAAFQMHLGNVTHVIIMWPCTTIRFCRRSLMNFVGMWMLGWSATQQPIVWPRRLVALMQTLSLLKRNRTALGGGNTS